MTESDPEPAAPEPADDGDPDQDPDEEPLDRALELLGDVDDALRAQASSTIADLENARLERLEDDLNTVEELLEQHENQRSLTDTVRDAVSQRLGSDDQPELPTVIEQVVEFQRRVIEIRRQESVLDEGLDGIGFAALSLAYELDDPVEEHLEDARDLVENGDRYLATFDDLRASYRTFEKTYDRAHPELERLELDSTGAETYLVVEESAIDDLEPAAELFCSMAGAVGRVFTGRAAFESDRWAEAAETLETATAQLEDGRALLQRVEEHPAENPFEAVLGRSFDESDLRRTEQGLSELLELTQEFHEAARTAADGDPEAATDRYEATVDRLDDISYN